MKGLGRMAPMEAAMVLLELEGGSLSAGLKAQVYASGGLNDERNNPIQRALVRTLVYRQQEHV